MTVNKNAGAGAGAGRGPDLAAKLNAEIDCEDLAERLGLERPQQKGNFRSPHHPDKAPSVSVFNPSGGGPKRWKDWSTGESGGPVDLVMWARGLDFPEAVKEVAGMYGVSVPRPARAGAPLVQRELTRAEYIAGKCLEALRDGGNKTAVLDYLEGRKVAREVIEQAMKKGSLAVNTWVNPTAQQGEVGYGGLAAAFLVRSRLDGQVLAVDMRFLDAEKNGGVKTQSQGEKVNAPWTSDWKRVEGARTVYVVESAVNALSIESCNIPATAAVATRGTATIDGTDWSFLRGKQVIAVFDNDKPLEHGPDKGFCAGMKAAWRLHEVLTGMDISCLLVDQGDWFEDAKEKEGPINDANDFLQLLGVDALTKALAKLETWMIPGMVGDDTRVGRSRLFLPAHDYLAYWRYRVQPDFTKVIGKVTKDDESGTEKYEFQDVCGFRVAAVSRVQIASPTSTMTGDVDHSARTVFSLSVQVPRHGPKLQRRVVDDERLHNIDVWKKLGPVYAPTAFARLLNVWERAASIGAREAINFVGLAWRDGRPVVNEGPDCFFADPRQQCPYSDLVFPSGTLAEGRLVVEQFAATFRDCAALIPLVWGLGAHLKAFLGFWPHFVMQAEKGTGKSTLVKRLERAIAMVMSSRQSLQTEFRQLTSVSYTSHPVGWGEMSANKPEIINKAVHNLQECYQYEHTRRGAELIDYLLCAPVLLAGEDVPVQSLQGKVVRSELTLDRRGEVIPQDLPVFPVKQWLQFLARQKKAEVLELHATLAGDLFDNCIATTADAGAERMVNNYAALAVAWHLLCRFLEVEHYAVPFVQDLTKEMNDHIKETVSDRQPWAWITDKLLSEIAQGQFRYPFCFDQVDEVPVLCVRTGHVMAHISQTPALREFWDGLPVKSDRVWKKQLAAAKVLMTSKDTGAVLEVERTVKAVRVGHMVAFSLPALELYGLHATVPKEVEHG